MREMSRLQEWRVRTKSDTQRIVTTLIILVVLLAGASILSRGVFLKPTNLLNLVFQNVILGVASLGQFLVILTAGIDLSVGAMVGLSTVLLMVLQSLGLPTAIVAAIGVPLVIGAVNGFFVSARRLPAFVVTLAMMLFTYSLAQVISGGAGVYSGLNGAPLSPWLATFNKSALLGIPYPAIVWLAMIGATSLYVRLSVGHFAYAVGGNEKAARLSGVPVVFVRFLTYVAAALLAAVGGILAVARVGEGHPAAGQTYLLDSIAAVTIGGTSLAGGQGSVIGTLMGVIILGTINNIMNLLNISPMLQPAVKGLVILVAVYINSRRQRG